MAQRTNSMTKLALSISVLFGLALFQNCTPSFERSSPESVFSSLGSNNNGQPYDGKPYIVPGPCPDGTKVRSRFVAKASGAVLYRENCQEVAARPITQSELSADPSDPSKIRYAGLPYEIERPAIPLPGVISWYYQLTGTLQPRPASIYVIDMFDNDAQTIQSLKDEGHTVICNVSAGTSESWRPDASKFAAQDLGNQVSGGAGERWIDTRSAGVRSIMLARLDLAKSKGCHGIDFDSVDGFSNSTGFPLTATTQLEYNQYLAFAAHDRRLILSLNNVPELATELSQIFDFAVAEECFKYDECAAYRPFIDLGKPVLAMEYSAVQPAQCQVASEESLSLAYFDKNLDGSRYETCQ